MLHYLLNPQYFEDGHGFVINLTEQGLEIKNKRDSNKIMS